MKGCGSGNIRDNVLIMPLKTKNGRVYSIHPVGLFIFPVNCKIFDC